MTNQHPTRTQEDIADLKNNWIKNSWISDDGYYEIEFTPGFEAHFEELKAWREEYEKIYLDKQEVRDARRIEKVMLETGIGKADREMLLSLHTFAEIEAQVSAQDRNIGAVQDPFEYLSLSLKQEQIYATLLQAAQLKRIADVLESMADGDTLSNSVKIHGSGE